MRQRLVLDILITGRSLQTHSVIVCGFKLRKFKIQLLINNVTYIAQNIPIGEILQAVTFPGCYIHVFCFAVGYVCTYGYDPKRPGNVTACKISKHLSGTLWV